jgi:proteic killer suppression protein
MIRSFKCDKTEALFEGEAVARFANFRKVAERKLQMLHRSKQIEDLRIPPGNRLEALSGDRRGQSSIRINDQWRLCFVWVAGDATEVEIVDYH